MSLKHSAHRPFSYHRSASFLITLFGTIINVVLVIQLLAASRYLKWESETEWESSADRWGVDALKLLWVLLTLYFTAAGLICSLGFVGVVKSKLSLVRFYRDYSIADFGFSIVFIALSAYAGFRYHLRSAVCEELSGQPELMRDLSELGLGVENCERWIERAVMAFVAVSLIVLVARLHFLLAISNFYSHLCRYHHQRTPPTGSISHTRSHSRSQRIYILPSSTPVQGDAERTLVYAPVPLHELAPEVAQDLCRNAQEAWVKPAHSSSRHQHRESEDTTGRICLPSLPDEPLLPAYRSNSKV